MPRIRKSASGEFLKFLKGIELDHYAEELVDATGLWHLKDYLDTVSIESDLEDCLKNDMRKLEIRKLFQKLMERKNVVREEQLHAQGITLKVDLRSCESPPATTRSSTASAVQPSLGTTRSSTVSKEGWQFEVSVRRELCSAECCGAREKLDYRDFGDGFPETDYVERLCQPTDLRMLLPQDRFTPSSHTTLQPGILLYEMKLHTCEPAMGKAVGQLFRRMDLLKEREPQRHIHLIVVAAVPSHDEVHAALARVASRYPDVIFFATRFQGMGYQGSQYRTRSLSFGPLGHRRPSIKARRLPSLPPIQQKGSSDEAETEAAQGAAGTRCVTPSLNASFGPLCRSGEETTHPASCEEAADLERQEGNESVEFSERPPKVIPSLHVEPTGSKIRSISPLVPTGSQWAQVVSRGRTSSRERRPLPPRQNPPYRGPPLSTTRGTTPVFKGLYPVSSDGRLSLPGELAEVKDTMKNGGFVFKICRMWHTTGNCRDGSACEYIHNAYTHRPNDGLIQHMTRDQHKKSINEFLEKHGSFK